MSRKPRYVKIVLEGEVLEDPSSASFFSSKTQIAFNWLMAALKAARSHKRVRCLLLVIKRPSISWSQVEEIQRELDLLREAGKECRAFLEQGDNLSYYLASAAQKIYMPPVSHLELVGLRMELLFFRDLLAQVGVSPELFNVGRFKSAAETFTAQGMSEANREAMEALIEDVQQRLRERIAQRTSASLDQVGEWINQGPYTSSSAHGAGLIDGLGYEDELERQLEKDFPGISPLAPARLAKREGFFKRQLTRWRPQIGYIVAEGMITEGRSQRGPARRTTVGADSLRELLERARESRRIKAVLLRVNSPGGSALASDVIWREVLRTREKKPVVVSMGGTAASGGYYIASAASRILAMPSTLTGSIGVVGGKFSGQELLRKIHVGVDSVQRGARSGVNSFSQPYSPDEAQHVRGHLEEYYDMFVKRVAEGRGQAAEEVKAVAEGRVWTGHHACQRKMVDALGGINAGIEAAREAAGIPKTRKVRIVPLAVRRRLRDLLSFPLLESSLESRFWALLPMNLRIK